MVTVDSENNTTHTVILIPRFKEVGESMTMDLYNEETQVSEAVDIEYTFLDGYLTLTFEYAFIEGQKFQIKLTEDNVILFRGKLMVTSQTPQTFKATNGLYITYE
jgi:hypothetical protein